ncbi:hypothetical protein SAMN05444483_101412 [Salegentibacter echinorum]|uniref:MetA-pathway of phenol degradation n=1 Tax=Salegentibacter echinorum TaxID=1073325 RepID=A0A1M5C9P9_SALEC|nr:hypothetical protein [Salegentibacter echinorum]SHF51473.1 hypothetical protein SAMN05444483_101412 [Salegentibacter echinorum]
MKNFINKYREFYFLLFLCIISLTLQAQQENEFTSSGNINSEEQAKTETSFIERFSIKQHKEEDFNAALGQKRYFRSYLNYDHKRIHFEMGAGPITQSSYLNPMVVDQLIGADARFEYALNKTFSLYAFGRFVSKSLNKKDFKSFYAVEPFFYNSEVGAGIKGSFNNLKIDLGTRTALDAPVNQVGPKTRINSSFSLEF